MTMAEVSLFPEDATGSSAALVLQLLRYRPLHVARADILHEIGQDADDCSRRGRFDWMNGRSVLVGFVLPGSSLFKMMSTMVLRGWQNRRFTRRRYSSGDRCSSCVPITALIFGNACSIAAVNFSLKGQSALMQ